MEVPVIHPVPGKCRISHYSVLPGPGKIMGPSNKKKQNFSYFLLFITVSKKSYGIVDKNIFCRIKNVQSYKLVFYVQYFLIFTVYCSSCHSLKSVSRTLSCCIDNCLNKKNKTNTRLTFLPLFLIC